MFTGIKTKNYKLVGCDLRKTSELEKLLSLAGLDYEIPTLLLSEVVMTYMDPERYVFCLFVCLFVCLFR